MQQQDYSDVYEKRKHKLFKALADYTPNDLLPNSPRIHLLTLHTILMNKDNHTSQLSYFLKHQFHCDLTLYTEIFMEMIWEIMEQRSGSLLAFVVYRLTRKYPGMFWKVQNFLEIKIDQIQWNINQLVFFVDMYLYGWPVMLETFMAKIFTHFKEHLVMIVPKYYLQLSRAVHFPVRQQKIFKNSILTWLEEEKQHLIGWFERLTSTSLKLQQSMVEEGENETQLNKYETELEEYETLCHKYRLASQCMDISFDIIPFRLKTVYQLKQECKTYQKIQLSAYQRSLYTISTTSITFKSLKKHQMLKLQQNDAFIIKIKMSSKLEECTDLAGYFLEQMNLQTNREYLIETIINQCFNYNNISYILKIVAEIGYREPSIKDYCSVKAKKICSANRMNPKYQKLLCQMTRFSLIDEKILLDYCEHMLRIENNQVTRQIQTILEHLGTLVYYRSLPTHIKINALFDRMEHIIKNKMTHFNMEHLYQLKGILNYLRNPNKTSTVAETHEMAKIDIKQNFDFILSKMQKKIKQKDHNYILEYMVCGIDSEVYLTTYYYASLLRQLNNKDLDRQVQKLTADTINKELKDGNCQKAVRWSRLLGELYNYECMSRKTLLSDLSKLLQMKEEERSGGLKCICAALDTARTYLQQANFKKQRQIIQLLLKLKIAYFQFKDTLEHSLNCEILDILEYFNPHLLVTLNSIEQIQQYLKLEGQFLQDNNWSSSQLISMLAQGYSMEQLGPNNRISPQSKKKYKEKESTAEKSQRKWAEKPIYTEKIVDKIQQIEKQDNRNETRSRESSNTLESATVKKMKFMGRSRRDNKIKTISCTIIDTQPQN